MRLTGAHIQGYGRLADTRINLDAKVIAVLGPNESGKTTLLRALAHIERETPLDTRQRSRALDVPDDLCVVTLTFILNEDDLGALKNLELETEPLQMTLQRKAGGGPVIISVTPKPEKSTTRLQASLDAFRVAVQSGAINEMVNPDTTYADEGGDAPRSMEAESQQVLMSIDAILSGEDGHPTENHVIAAIISIMSGLRDDEETEPLRGSLRSITAWLQTPDPAPEAKRILWGRSPDLLLFSESERTLNSTYELDATLAADPPGALANLTSMAGLDLAALLQFIGDGDVGRRETIIAKANRKLEEIFKRAWKQSVLSVRFLVDGSLLRVVIWENSDAITAFDERSSGLRAFISLVSFLSSKGSGISRPILLVDEAENHLHIDAQADLINMFLTQEQAEKVIYTTHSPACLPPDLGSSVRAVVPLEGDRPVSEISNSFWVNKAGFSPLMFAMGAGAAAFTPARYVVLAEGASDMIMLPSLIRAATDQTSLPYQIAPGLSEVPQSLYGELDLEGAKVAYLVDADAGGTSLKKRLLAAGVAETRIVSLRAPGVESLLDEQLYLAVLKTLLGESNFALRIEDWPLLPGGASESWYGTVKTWAEARDYKMPSKVAIATNIVNTERAKPAARAKDVLASVHAEIVHSLNIVVK